MTSHTLTETGRNNSSSNEFPSHDSDESNITGSDARRAAGTARKETADALSAHTGSAPSQNMETESIDLPNTDRKRKIQLIQQ